MRTVLLPTLCPLLTLGLGLVAGAAVAWDAAARRDRSRQSDPEVLATVRLLGTADLALSSASRWLRHPSLSEPGAAFADGVAVLDADPAGALISPPEGVFTNAITAGAAPPPTPPP